MDDTGGRKTTLFALYLKRRYVVALSLIALLTIFSQIFVQMIFLYQEHDSHIINIAGRQRMLSQQIAKSSTELLLARTPGAIKKIQTELKVATALLYRSHQGLQFGDKGLHLPGDNGPAVTALFAAIAKPYHAMVKAARALLFARVGSASQRRASDIIRNNEATFLNGMNKIVFLYDKKAREKVDFIGSSEMVLLFLTLTVLLLEAKFIFAPATRRINRDIKTLARRQRDLEKLFSVSPTALLLIDPKDISILRANAKAEKVLHMDLAKDRVIKLTDFVDPKYKVNRRLLAKMEDDTVINEFDIIVINAEKSVMDMLASVRTIEFQGQSLWVFGLTDVSDIKKAQDVLERRATTDDLTELFNRRTGMTFLKKAMASAKRRNASLQIAFVDLDNLKLANDIQGHSEGDWFIRTVGNALSGIIRKADIICRMGGDEFMIILVDCDASTCAKLMEYAKIRLNEIQCKENKGYSVSFSYGIASYDPQQHSCAKDLIVEADRMMYRDKCAKKLTVLPEQV